MAFDHPLTQDIGALRFIGDLAQGNDGVLVVVAVDRRSAIRRRFRAHDGRQAEPVRTGSEPCQRNLRPSRGPSGTSVTWARKAPIYAGQPRLDKRSITQITAVSSTKAALQRHHRRVCRPRAALPACAATVRPSARMHPIWCHLGQRHQHESPILQPRMRHDQLVRRRRAACSSGGSSAPAILRRWHQAAPNRPAPEDRGPASASPSATGVLRPKPASTRCSAASTAAASIRLGQEKLRSRVHIVRPCPGRKARRAEKPAESAKFKPFALQPRQRRRDRRFRRRVAKRQIGAERNQSVLNFCILTSGHTV